MSESGASVAVHVAKGASYIVFQNVVTNGMLVVCFSILARLITPVEMGEMAVLLMVIGASRVVVCLGMPSSVTKFIAGSMAKNDRVTAAGAFYQALKANLLLSLPVAAGVFWSSELLSTWLLGTPERAILFQILGFDIVVAAGLLPTLNSAMLGLQKIKEMSTANLIYMATRQILILALVLVTRSLLGLVVAWVVSEIGLAAMFLRLVESSIGPPTFRFDLKRLAGFSFPLFFQDAANYAYTWFDRAALLTYLPLESLGMYTTAMTAFGVLVGFADAIGMSLFPTYSAIREEHGNEILGYSVKGATRYVSLIVLPLCFGLFSTAKPFLVLFVGESYARATGPLMVLSLFAAFTLVSTAFTGLLVVWGETLLSLKLSALNIGVGAASTLILLPSLGIVGASIARGIAMTTNLAAMMIVLRSRVSVGFDIEAFRKALVSSGVMTAVVLLLQAYYPSSYLLPICVVVGGFIYFSMLFVLRAIKVQDVQLLDEYLGPRLRFIVRPLRRLLGESRA